MNLSELIDTLSQKAAKEPDIGSKGEKRAPEGAVYTARIYYIYRLALDFVEDAKEKAELKADFDEFCKMANTTKYELGRGFRWVSEKCIDLEEYELAMRFMNLRLFDLNREAAGVVLSEENMLLYMMLEIAASEKNNGTAASFREFFQRYNRVENFKPPYVKLKLFARRVWLGIPHSAKELEEIMDSYPVSGEMLAVIVKYSVIDKVWCDAFARVTELLGDGRPDVKKTMQTYIEWLRANGKGQDSKCRKMSDIDNGIVIKKIRFSSPPAGEAAGENSENEGKENPSKIAFIFCTYDEQYEAETIRYLRTLKKPDGINSVEVLPVWEGKGMASAYNFAMGQTDAKYKIYIHHDTFVFDPDMLDHVMKLFKEHPEAGMAGVAGSIGLGEDCKWFEVDKEHIRMDLYQDILLDILVSVSAVKNGPSEEVTALDGVFLATQKDVPWNEKVFDHWHFYDISQCYEMRKAGYTCRILNSYEPFLMHETTMRKDPFDYYYKYAEIFKKEYMT